MKWDDAIVSSNALTKKSKTKPLSSIESIKAVMGELGRICKNGFFEFSVKNVWLIYIESDGDDRDEKLLTWVEWEASVQKND